jgi:hypothetical protein
MARDYRIQPVGYWIGPAWALVASRPALPNRSPRAPHDPTVLTPKSYTHGGTQSDLNFSFPRKHRPLRSQSLSGPNLGGEVRAKLSLAWPPPTPAPDSTRHRDGHFPNVPVARQKQLNFAWVELRGRSAAWRLSNPRWLVKTPRGLATSVSLCRCRRLVRIGLCLTRRALAAFLLRT